MLRRKILLLGDTLCGKTFLANEWSQKNIHQVDTHAMQTFIQSTWMEGRQIELVIWDNAGLDRYEGFRRLSYNLVHVVLICFDISNPDSFENIDYVWNVEADNYLRNVLKVLVGCKKDLRSDEATLKRLRRQSWMPVSPYAVCVILFNYLSERLT
jgi:small GTP-binding protein